jgi:hypothetical protein
MSETALGYDCLACQRGPFLLPICAKKHLCADARRGETGRVNSFVAMAKRSERCQTNGVPRRPFGTFERGKSIAFGDGETGSVTRHYREMTPPRPSEQRRVDGAPTRLFCQLKSKQESHTDCRLERSCSTLWKETRMRFLRLAKIRARAEHFFPRCLPCPPFWAPRPTRPPKRMRSSKSRRLSKLDKDLQHLA